MIDLIDGRSPSRCHEQASITSRHRLMMTGVCASHVTSVSCAGRGQTNRGLNTRDISPTVRILKALLHRMSLCLYTMPRNPPLNNNIRYVTISHQQKSSATHPKVRIFCNCIKFSHSSSQNIGNDKNLQLLHDLSNVKLSMLMDLKGKTAGKLDVSAEINNF